jgi:hypothetical protein
MSIFCSFELIYFTDKTVILFTISNENIELKY